MPFSQDYRGAVEHFSDRECTVLSSLCTGYTIPMLLSSTELSQQLPSCVPIPSHSRQFAADPMNLIDLARGRTCTKSHFVVKVLPMIVNYRLPA